jgi:hypothetical protein
LPQANQNASSREMPPTLRSSFAKVRSLFAKARFVETQGIARLKNMSIFSWEQSSINQKVVVSVIDGKSKSFGFIDQ